MFTAAFIGSGAFTSNGTPSIAIFSITSASLVAVPYSTGPAVSFTLSSYQHPHLWRAHCITTATSTNCFRPMHPLWHSLSQWVPVGAVSLPSRDSISASVSLLSKLLSLSLCYFSYFDGFVERSAQLHCGNRQVRKMARGACYEVESFPVPEFLKHWAEQV
jgi:hypothetical protein